MVKDKDREGAVGMLRAWWSGTGLRWAHHGLEASALTLLVAGPMLLAGPGLSPGMEAACHQSRAARDNPLPRKGYFFKAHRDGAPPLPAPSQGGVHCSRDKLSAVLTELSQILVKSIKENRCHVSYLLFFWH